MHQSNQRYRSSHDKDGIAAVIQEDECDNDQSIILAEDRRRVEGEPEILDLSQFEFTQGGHTMKNKRCLLPEGSFKKPGKGYERIHIPASQLKPMDVGETLIFLWRPLAPRDNLSPHLIRSFLRRFRCQV